MKSLFVRCAASLSLLCVLAACGKKAEAPLSAPVSLGRVQELQLRIDPEHPGRGTTDYPGNTSADVPKSYAMVLLAELQRSRHRGTQDWPDLGSVAGQWLLDHADENRDGVIGWGVPVAWDAYGDGSTNPAHTEYSISTAIVIDALLSWREFLPAAKARDVLALAEKAARPYLDGSVLSPSGLLPYSLQPSDRRYDTFNSAMYLAGQFQRLSRLTADAQLAGRLRAVADMTVASLLKHRQTSPDTGAWYWHYSIQETIPNDLPHASYIALGLADYARHGGRLAGQVDLDAVFAHLTEFLPDPRAPKEARPPGSENAPRPWIRAWPRLRKDISRPARSYDLGMALHLACTEGRLASMRPHLLAAVDDYRTQHGNYQKYPVGSDQPPLVVAEYESYLYRGLSSCLVAGAEPGQLREEPFVARPAATPAVSRQVSEAVAPRPLEREVQVPFVSLHDGSQAVSVRYSPADMRSRIVLADGRSHSLPEPGVPVSLVWRDGQLDAVFVRTLPAGELLLVQPQAPGKPLRIRHAPDREPMFRAATLHQGGLYLVYYDNPTLANYLVRFSAGPQGYALDGPPVRLPLLEDPAGGTYEMIPRVEFVASGSRLWVVGGTLAAEVQAGSVREARLPNCLRAVEAVATPEGPAALCASKTAQGSGYLLAGPRDGQRELPAENGLPWNLRLQKDGTLVVDYAARPEELANLLRWDLRRAQQAGWLEFGVDNDEGRIPWSQIYYLNGFLDVLALAHADDAAARLFLPLLKPMRERLDLEMSLLDRHWRSGRYRTRAFTVDRSPALFSVQTARLLLLMDRYLREVPDPVRLASHGDVRRAVQELRGHIEVLARSGEEPRWLAPGRAHLRWPKGSKFYFDGLAVPFNHQNEWAYAVLRTDEGAPARPGPAQTAALDILRFFGEQVAPGGALPSSGSWNYWWGKAFDGWSAAEGISLNKPSYEGDKIKAWISFRSIDAMGMLSAYPHLPPVDRERLVLSAAKLVHEGKLYPFVGYELLRHGMLVLPSTPVARAYARVSSPWELQSAAWALARLAGVGSTR